MNTITITEKINELLRFLPAFEEPERDFILRWDGGESTDGTTFYMPRPVYAEDVVTFFGLVGQHF